MDHTALQALDILIREDTSVLKKKTLCYKKKCCNKIKKGKQCKRCPLKMMN